MADAGHETALPEHDQVGWVDLRQLRAVAWGRAARVEKERRTFPWINPTAIFMDVSYVQALALCADEEWDIDPIHN